MRDRGADALPGRAACGPDRGRCRKPPAGHVPVDGLAVDGDDPQQIGGWRAFPATHAGAHRIRTTYHWRKSTPTACADRGIGVIAGAGWARGRVRSGCRCASRSTGPRAGRSAPPGRSPARAGSRAPSPGRSGWPRRQPRPAAPWPATARCRRRCAGSSDQSMMSIFSPCSSLITARTRWPIGPMQAPLALTPGCGRPHRDLGTVPGLAGDRGDLHRAVGDLRHLQREQPPDQVRMRYATG